MKTWPKLSIAGVLVVLLGGIAPACQTTDPTAAPQDASTDHRLGGYQPWGTAGSPGGSNLDVQFNNSGAFGGATNITYDGTSLNLTSNVGSTNFGATPAAIGDVRATHNTTIVASRNAANSADLVVAASDSGSSLMLGADSTLTGHPFTSTYVCASSNVNFSVNNAGTPQVAIGTGLDTHGVPIAIVNGSAAASVGDLRLSNNSSGIAVRNAANSLDHNMLVEDSSNTLTVGDNNNAATLVRSASSVGLLTGGAYAMSMSTSEIDIALPAFGRQASSSPYSAHGEAVVADPGGASHTATAAEYSPHMLMVCAALGSATTGSGGSLILPRPTTGAGYPKWIYDGCNSTLSVQAVGLATPAAIANSGKIMGVWVNHAGVFRLTPDTTP